MWFDEWLTENRKRCNENEDKSNSKLNLETNVSSKLANDDISLDNELYIKSFTQF